MSLLPGVLRRVLSAVCSERCAPARVRLAIAICATLGLSYALLSTDPWWFVRWLRGDAARVLEHGVSDKLYHVCGYLTLTVCLMWWAVSRSRKATYLAGAVAAVHAVSTELLQHFVPGRTVDGADFVADLAGVSVGFSIGLLLRHVQQSTRDPAGLTTAMPQRQLRERRLGGSMKTADSSLTSREHPAGLTRSQITSEEAAEIRPRMINYRFVAILLAAGGVFFSSVVAIHGWQMRRNAGTLIELGERAREDGDFTKARDYFNRYVGMVPNDTNALATLGILLDESAEGPGAQRQIFAIYEDVLRADPTREDIRRRQIATATAIGRYSDALSHVQTLQQIYSTDGKLALQAGLCQQQMGEYEQAGESFEQAIDFSPRLIDAWAALANLRLDMLDEAEQAAALLDRLVELNANDPAAWLARAKFRQRIGKLDAAADDLQQALDRDGENGDLLLAATELGYERIAAARSRGQAPKAERLLHLVRNQLKRAMELAPDRLDLRLQAIVIESHFGDQQQALQRLAELLSDHPGDHRAHVLLADLTIERGEFDKAHEAINRLPRTPGSDALRLFLDGRIAMAQKQWRQALSLFNEARRFQADTPEMLERTDIAIATCHRELGETDQELVTLRQVMKYHPKSVPGRLALASSLLRQKKLQAAIAEYRPLASLPQVRLLLARLLILQNLQLPEVAREWREAETLLTEATKHGADPTQVALLQAELLASQGRIAAAEQLLIEARTSQADRLEFLVALARLAQQAGDRQHAALWMGQALAAAGNSRQAESQLQQALDLSPGDAATARTLMELYVRAGRQDEALALFRRHAQKMSVTELAQAYALFGDHARAAELFQREAANEAADLKALDGLASVYLQNGLSSHAETLLERLVGDADATTTIGQSARRRLALLLNGHNDYASRQRALELLDENTTATPQPAVEDLRIRAAVLASSLLADERAQAILLFETLDDQNQLLPRDRWLLGKLYESIGRLDEATAQLERSLQNGEVSERLLSDYVEHLVEHADRDTAERGLKRLRSRFPEAATALRLETRLAVKYRETTQAVTLLTSFVAAASDQEQKVARLTEAAAVACAAGSNGDSNTDLDAAALAFLTEAVKLDPRQVGQLVAWQLNHGRDVEAFEQLDEVWQQLDPEAAAGLSLAMLSTGPTHARMARVDEKLTTALKQRPQALLIKVCLADLRSLQERYAEAESLYRQVLHVDMQNLPALNNLAWLLGMQRRDADDALTLIERAMQTAGLTPQLLDTRACILLGQHRTRQAIADLQQAMANGQATSTLLLHLAAAQLDDRNPEAARATLTQAQATGFNASLLHPLDQVLLQRLINALQVEQTPASSDV
ncbi:tetratricopeptide repeat protein [bacterium]|nr:tetratricopeptide repeat protein [bacterium]